MKVICIKNHLGFFILMPTAPPLERLSEKNLLHPYGDLDVLLYYALAARKLKKFLRGKEIAAKNWIPGYKRQLLKRGSLLPPLWIEDFIETVTPEFLEKRKGHLKDIRPQLSKNQVLVWQYFLPRKLSDFFYATNNEK